MAMGLHFKELAVGDVVYEQEGGYEIPVEVLTQPTGDRGTWTFTARIPAAYSVSGTTEVAYLMRDDSPQYAPYLSRTSFRPPVKGERSSCLTG